MTEKSDFQTWNQAAFDKLCSDQFEDGCGNVVELWLRPKDRLTWCVDIIAHDECIWTNKKKWMDADVEEKVKIAGIELSLVLNPITREPVKVSLTRNRPYAIIKKPVYL